MSGSRRGALGPIRYPGTAAGTFRAVSEAVQRGQTTRGTGAAAAANGVPTSTAAIPGEAVRAGLSRVLGAAQSALGRVHEVQGEGLLCQRSAGRQTRRLGRNRRSDLASLGWRNRSGSTGRGGKADMADRRGEKAFQRPAGPIKCYLSARFNL